MSSALIGHTASGPRRPVRAAAFTELEFAGLPEPVCRYLAGAIAVDAPLHSGIRVDIRGHLRRRRWVPFRAHYELTQRLDFTGVGAAAEVVAGVERCVDGVAWRRARLAGVVPLGHDAGDQLARSAAGRAALAAVALPTALLPRSGVAWTADGDDQIAATFTVHDVPVVLRLRIDGDGRPLAAAVQRWGDPDRTGTWGWHAFGAVFTNEASFAGMTVPSAGRVGWFAGTERWGEGEVLRFRVVTLRRTGGPRVPAPVSR